MAGRVGLFLASLLASHNVIMDLVDRQPHPACGCAARLPLLESSRGQWGEDMEKMTSGETRTVIRVMHFSIVLSKLGRPGYRLNHSTSLQYDFMESYTQATFSALILK